MVPIRRFGMCLVVFLLATAAYGQEESRKHDLPDVVDNPLSRERINLGPSINSQYSDLFPVISPDETTLFFVRKGDPANVGYKKNPNDEDIWYCVRQADGTWSPAAHLPGPLNTDNYDGVRAMNSTNTRLYLQNIYRADGTGAKGFSVSEKLADGTWSFPEALEIEDYYNDTSIAMMSISVDEKVMILSLKRKGGKGMHDLYVTRNLGGRKWSAPEWIEALSTPGDDISPFIAYDDRTMYFSTSGLGGLGGADIFITRRLDNTWLHWSTPRNLGAPINTPSFDAYFMVSAQGDSAYFSSPHESSTRGYGKSDLWKIGLKPLQRPGFNLPSGFAADGSIDSTVKEEDLTGSLLRLDKVHFDVGKSTLNQESMEVMTSIANLMKRFPGLTIEVQGHTDSDGDPDRNLKLSQTRADAVRTYLMARGITGDRIDAIGYGQTRPIAPNDNSRGKALNRRVMILVKNPAEAAGKLQD